MQNYMQKAVRRRNRQLRIVAIDIGRKRKLNQAPEYVHGFQLFGRFQMPDGRRGFILGGFNARTLDGGKISTGTGFKKLNPLAGRTAIPAERKEGVRHPPHA
ncbi:MAG: hypothetical protein LBU32_24035 [Clostridiales bacterium]|nr:hypothetical protein [Clostridiales bacterium]